MRNANLTLLLVPLVALGLWGCGSADLTGSDDFEAGNRLTVSAVVDGNGNSTLISAAVEETDDSGTDGDSATVDADGSQNNGWPDPGEALVTPLSNDVGVISLRNDPRPGVDPGVSLEVYRVDITFKDSAGQSYEFAPPASYDVALSVPSGGTADLNVILVPVTMKAAIRNLMVNARNTAVVPQLNATVDVYARDVLNDDDVHAQGAFSIQFINPMIQG